MTSVCLSSMALGHNMMSSQNYIKHTPIAPAPAALGGRPLSTTVLGMNGSNLQQLADNGYKSKKYTYANMPCGEQPASVVRRNARERNRVKQVNNGFVNLRQHIPQTVVSALSSGGRGASKKLSKVDTLRMAVEYIRRLQDVIDEADSDAASTSTYSGGSQGSTAGSPPPSMFYSEQYSMPMGYSPEASASPTPSYNSDVSIGSQTYQPTFKFEAYDSYNQMPSTPDDEELLDYISSWQEQ